MVRSLSLEQWDKPKGRIRFMEDRHKLEDVVDQMEVETEEEVVRKE